MEHQRDLYQQRGYSDDLLPKRPSNETGKHSTILHYGWVLCITYLITLWLADFYSWTFHVQHHAGYYY